MPAYFLLVVLFVCLFVLGTVVKERLLAYKMENVRQVMVCLLWSPGKKTVGLGY